MRLVTYRDERGARVGALRGDDVIPLDDFADMLALIDGGADALARAQAAVQAEEAASEKWNSAPWLLRVAGAIAAAVGFGMLFFKPLRDIAPAAMVSRSQT